jgi:hypothetical protein
MGMPGPRSPHLHRETTRHGRAVWYVRIGQGPRIRIRAPFGTPEFDQEYQSAVSGERLAPKGKGTPAGSLAWLITRYREKPAWTALSLATRRQRENILRQVIETAGRQPFAAITASAIAAGRDRRGKTHRFRRGTLSTPRAVCLVSRDIAFGPDRKAVAGFEQRIFDAGCWINPDELGFLRPGE